MGKTYKFLGNSVISRYLAVRSREDELFEFGAWIL